MKRLITLPSRFVSRFAAALLLAASAAGANAAAPEIVVEQPAGTNVADGGSVSFGSVNVGSSSTLTFTIKNTGDADLTGLAITKSGADSADFTVTGPVATTVTGPSGSTTFTVQFTPSANRAHAASIAIANNDSDENPFNISLSGTGLAPEIAVEQPAGTNIADGGSKSFGSVDYGSSARPDLHHQEHRERQPHRSGHHQERREPGRLHRHRQPDFTVACRRQHHLHGQLFSGRTRPRSAAISTASSSPTSRPTSST
ncbi:MAG: choice-of-anchor D domain-containing protein [Akkermansiaceae bacterium]|nr:choice-of-anchor D domain-containing protein [Akkermansiaceae bacterium]